jgi:predicted component of type VI protein secretion system
MTGLTRMEFMKKVVFALFAALTLSACGDSRSGPQASNAYQSDGVTCSTQVMVDFVAAGNSNTGNAKKLKQFKSDYAGVHCQIPNSSSWIDVDSL